MSETAETPPAQAPRRPRRTPAENVMQNTPAPAACLREIPKSRATGAGHVRYRLRYWLPDGHYKSGADLILDHADGRDAPRWEQATLWSADVDYEPYRPGPGPDPRYRHREGALEDATRALADRGVLAGEWVPDGDRQWIMDAPLADPAAIAPEFETHSSNPGDDPLRSLAARLSRWGHECAIDELRRVVVTGTAGTWGVETVRLAGDWDGGVHHVWRAVRCGPPAPGDGEAEAR
jgi:hypothetical protein